ncbi:MAG: hypothetical protein IT466_00670 [Moraxellaceae bacterium]|nr:hypothetical protein [Moraxellaceae bacterium]
MNIVSRQLPLIFILASSLAMAETTSAPVVPATPATSTTATPPTPARPVVQVSPAAVAVKPVAATAIAPKAATVTNPATTATTPTTASSPSPQSAQPAASSPVFENILNSTPAISVEQRRQQEVLANAERIDKANRDLLARNQELQLQMENLSIQNNQLKLDRSSEGIWKGAGAVIVGFLMGWVFSGIGRRKSSW